MAALQVRGGVVEEEEVEVEEEEVEEEERQFTSMIHRLSAKFG